jgi:hypothetical protein
MKNLKSILVIIMVLVIGVCLTACQTPAQKAESERLVSESVSESERAVSESVSESVSVSERVLLEETQKIENAEFTKWFSDGILGTGETGGVTLSFSLSDYADEHIDKIKTATLTIDETNYLFTDFSFESPSAILGGTYLFEDLSFKSFTEFGTGLMDGAVLVASDVTLNIEFNDISTTEYDSLTVTLKDKDDKEVTLIYYPNAE